MLPMKYAISSKPCRNAIKANGVDSWFHLRLTGTFAAPLIPHSGQSKADDPVEHLRIGKTRFESGLREIFVLGEDRIRVGFDEINFVARCETQIETRVAV